jgi:hypothetical protein
MDSRKKKNSHHNGTRDQQAEFPVIVPVSSMGF